MRLRPHRRRNAVLWNARVTPLFRAGERAYSRSQAHWLLRTGMLLLIIAMVRLARGTRTRWEPVSLAAGALLTVAGFVRPMAPVFYSGVLVLIVALIARLSAQHRQHRQGRRDPAA